MYFDVKCSNCEHYYITWDRREPHGCRAMDFRTAGNPLDLVVKASGEKCYGFTLKKRLKKLNAKDGAREDTPFKKATLSAIELLEGAAAPVAQSPPSPPGYAVPWEEEPAAAEAQPTPAEEEPGEEPEENGEPPAEETRTQRTRFAAGALDGYALPWDTEPLTELRGAAPAPLREPREGKEAGSRQMQERPAMGSLLDITLPPEGGAL